MTRFALALIVSAGLALPTVAQANHVQVRYGDLDLSTSAGRATLDKRIGTAARSACTETAEGSQAAADRATRKCRAAVRAEATDRIASRLT